MEGDVDGVVRQLAELFPFLDPKEIEMKVKMYDTA
jgi:hypothetical protein